MHIIYIILFIFYLRILFLYVLCTFEVTNLLLCQFSVHSDLGRVVQAIIREFSKNPPQLLEDISPGSTKPHPGICCHFTCSFMCWYNEILLTYDHRFTGKKLAILLASTVSR